MIANGRGQEQSKFLAIDKQDRDLVGAYLQRGSAYSEYRPGEEDVPRTLL